MEALDGMHTSPYFKTTSASDFTNLVHGFVWGMPSIRGRVKVNVRNSVLDRPLILISAQFIISPHYSFMVQNQITVSLVGFCILDSLL